MQTIFLAILTVALTACGSRPHTSNLQDDVQPTWETVFLCENDEAVVRQSSTNDSLYQLTLKNNDLNRYLGLGYMPKPQGLGQPVAVSGAFVGFSSVISSFDHRNPNGSPSVTAHIFPEYDGLKVKVDREPYYLCDYNLLYGDSGGMTHTISAPLGSACPDLYPSYGFRNARPGSDQRTSKNWFFQNCQAQTL